MQIGLVGFPGSGKTTVFNALTGQSADTGFGSGSRKENLGRVLVPDQRVDALTKLFEPQKTTYAEIRFRDVGGGGAGGGQRSIDRGALNTMREMDALCQVVRSFDSDASAEPPDPEREIRDLEAELILADLEVIERRVERMKKERKTGPELELLERLSGLLEQETALRRVDLNADELALLAGFGLLSRKPLLLVLNVEEARVAEPAPAALSELAEARGLGLVVLSAKVEQDIAQMSREEQELFAAELGLGEPARDRFLTAAYALLDLISFLTSGTDECRAWPIRRGLTAKQAAGKIHSDIERGFIRAEVVRVEDLLELGSEAKCRDAGKMRTEGKEYVVQDGDVINFRFNV